MSWEESAKSYDKIVGDVGHYFHKHVILPRLQTLFSFEKYTHPKVLDLGAGSGILQEYVAPHDYIGIDQSSTMVEIAKKKRKGQFFIKDVTKPFSLEEKNFTHIVFLLSLQNMEDYKSALLNAKNHLSPDGRLYIVLNHPYFRIPRQSAWGIDENTKIQFRRIDRYLTPMAIPILMDPSRKESGSNTISYHNPLSHYINFLGSHHLGVTHMEELISDKVSTGKMAKSENRARLEFPLFMLLIVEPFFKKE